MGKFDRDFELRFRLRLRIEFISDTLRRREAENLCVPSPPFSLGILQRIVNLPANIGLHGFQWSSFGNKLANFI